MNLLKEKKFFQYTAVLILTALSYVIWRLVMPESDSGIQLSMGILITVSAVFCIIYKARGKLTDKEIVRAVILAGIVMRIGYMLYTPCDVRSHDLWEFEKDGYGHAGYIITLIQDKTLPQTNLRQYYQQPFFYLVSSIVSAATNRILGCSDPFYLVDTAKIVSCASSCFVLLMAESFCEFFELKGKGRIAAVAMTAFHPAFYLSIRITPDMLATFLMTAALLYTLKWYRSPDWKNTLLLAFIYGMAVMTKISAGSVAFFTAAVFLLKLAEQIKAHKLNFLIPKYIVFALISIPMGLWYNVRNYKLFDQEFGYVLRLPDDYPLYIGDHSFMQIFGIPDIANILEKPYISIYDDYNLFAYALKTSLFGEFSFLVPNVVPITLTLSVLAVTVFAVAALINGFRKPIQEKNLFFLSVTCTVFIASIIYFVKKYPHVCSMDFRYMTYLIIPFGILSGKYLQTCKSLWVRNILVISLILFSVSSCIMYIML